VSPSFCVAVGAFSPPGANQTLIQMWDGTTWSIVTSPNPGSTGYNAQLYGVSCTSASFCFAVGGWDLLAGFSPNITLTEVWDGTSWSIVTSPTPNVTNNRGGALVFGVDCLSASFCMAVGETAGPDSPCPLCPFGIGISEPAPLLSTLIEKWDGTSWSIISSPGLLLYGVSCANPGFCMAVGYYEIGSAPTGQPIFQTLTEEWDGTNWSIVSSPNRSPVHNNFLVGVSCVSPSFCKAAGFDQPASYAGAVGSVQTLIEEYSPTIPPLTGVVSTMTHGSAGTFDVDLPLTGSPGIECRSGGPNGNYQIVFSFVNNIASCGTASTGSLSSEPGSNQCTVNLTGVANQQNVTVTLSNVLDSQTNTGNVSATMGLLVGDVNASGVVTSGDTNLCKAQALQSVTNANFRDDINASGSITTGDVNLIKQNALAHLP
jgi:hypothetical protein